MAGWNTDRLTASPEHARATHERWMGRPSCVSPRYAAGMERNSRYHARRAELEATGLCEAAARKQAEHETGSYDHINYQCGGCDFYPELEGALGSDWGVCTNPASPYDSLVRFEHDGCPEHSCEHAREDWAEYLAAGGKL